ncbi:MAG: MMPL family transporter [Candidatus Riflebacteria bacterium]|nr:MMPL family transporter [Candidatus Riflebacteria bacterium]
MTETRWGKPFFDVWARRLTWFGVKGFPLIFSFSVISAIILGWFAYNNTYEYDLKDMMTGEDESFRVFHEFLDIFGPDDDIIVALPIKEFGLEAIQDAFKVKETIKGIPGIEGILDLSMAAGIKTPEDIEYLFQRPRLLQRKLDTIAQSRTIRGYLLGSDEKAQTIVIRTVSLSAKEKQELVRKIRAALENSMGYSKVHLGGYPVFAERYVHQMIRGNSIFLTLSTLGALGLSLLMFRSLSLTLAVGLVISIPVIWTNGLFSAMGYKISLFSTLLTPTLLFVGLSLAVQFIARFRLALVRNLPKDSQGVEICLTEAIAEALPPCFLCNLTAIVGFSSQIFSSMSGVRAFGIFSSLGAALAFFSGFILLPGFCFRMTSSLNFGQTSDAFERRIGRILARCILPPRKIFIGAVIFTGTIGWGIAYLHIGSNPLDAFPADDTVLVDHRFIDQHFYLGARQISLVLRSRGRNFDKIKPIQKMIRLRDSIASDTEVVSVICPTTILSDVQTQLSGRPDDNPQSDTDIDHVLRLASRNAPKLLSAFLNPPFFDRARISIGLKCSDAPGVARAAKRLELLANEVGGDDFSASATGRMLLSALVENKSVAMEIDSFSTAWIGILLIIGVGFRTIRAIFIAFIANFFPLVMAIGTMGWVGQSLDPATAMVPCLCLGIIVDDTIYIFQQIHIEESKGHGPWRCRAILMLRLGWALMSAALIPLLGMSILCFSDFGPIRQFGMYSVLAMFYGIFFDLFLTPALLAITRPDNYTKVS